MGRLSRINAATWAQKTNPDYRLFYAKRAAGGGVKTKSMFVGLLPMIVEQRPIYVTQTTMRASAFIDDCRFIRPGHS
jgi:hypothetical protein